MGPELDKDGLDPGPRRRSNDHKFSNKARKLMSADVNRVESFLDMSMLGGSIKGGHSFDQEHHPWEIDLDKLVCKTVIASGTYGTVYRGVYGDREVAIKVLDWGDNTTSRQQVAQLRKAFSQEVDVWKNLHHVNIVQVRGFVFVRSFWGVVRWRNLHTMMIELSVFAVFVDFHLSLCFRGFFWFSTVKLQQHDSGVSGDYPVAG
jgi:hypothetical protein